MYINDSYSNVGLTGMRWFDWYVRPGVSSQEGNNNCCAGDPGRPGVEDMEALQYALLSNNINYHNSNDLFNSVTQGVYEMGSTFKPITMAIGFDTDIINEESTFYVSDPIKIDISLETLRNHLDNKGSF